MLGGRSKLALIGVVLLATGSTAGGLVVGAGAGDEVTTVPEAGVESRAERKTSFLAQVIPPKPERRRSGGPALPRSITDLARRLPLEQKVAQLFLVGFQGQDLNGPVFRQLRRYDLGGIVISERNYTGPQSVGLFAGEAGVISQQEKHVPPWVMAAQEGGELNSFSDLPPSAPPADLESVEAAQSAARETAATLRPLGLNGLLGPVLDVGPETDPALGTRIYSDDPADVSGFGEATVAEYRKAKVFAAVKHFPGLGTANQPTEEGPAQVGLSLRELRRRDLRPFDAAFRAGAPGVVLSHALYVVDDFTVPGSLSRRVATGLLRRELRFRGVAITDDLADPPITALYTVPDAAVEAVKAGADMLYISGPLGDQQAAYVALLQAVRRGEVSRKRVDEALLRILVAKRNYGLIR